MLRLPRDHLFRTNASLFHFITRGCPKSRRLYQFFESTSFRARLSKVRSATTRFSFREVDTSLGRLRVRRVLDRVAAERGLPEAIVLDNGPEFRGRALAAWSQETARRGKVVDHATACLYKL